jgi:arylsulfatase
MDSTARNVVLISIDACRADHLSFLGYDRDTTPNLGDLSTRGMTFTNAFSASSHTPEAVPALLSGLHPDDAVNADGSRGGPTVASHLTESHDCAGFHSNPFVSRAYGFDKDFDHFDDDLRFGRNRLLALAERALDKFVFNKGSYHARAEEINSRALSWLDSRPSDGPFFLWNHYMDVHGPYHPPEGYDRYTDEQVSSSDAQALYEKLTDWSAEVSESEGERAKDLYDGEIRYLDDQLNRFLEALERRDLLSDTLLIVTADHGEAFGEHGYYAHPKRVHDELLHVPLVVVGPSTESKTVQTPVSTLDIVPTILEALGNDWDSLAGVTLEDRMLDGAEREYVYSSAREETEDGIVCRYAARSRNWKATLSKDESENEILNESVRRSEDGAREPMDSVSDDSLPEEAEALQETLRDHVDARRLSTGQGERETNQEIEERLEALGYK